MYEVHSAVTVINAFATGKGGAIGIDLSVRADVDIIEDGIVGDVEVRGEKYEDLSLVKTARDVISERFDIDFGVDVQIDSDIPIGKGLKSSSAVSNVLSKGITEELRLGLGDMEIIELGVEVSTRADVTLTGAFDDACASYLGGLCLTDNGYNELIKREEIDTVPVILLVPEKTVLTKDLSDLDFDVLRPYIEEAFELALKGRWKKALFLNGLLYSFYLGYDQEALKTGLEKGITVGLSGKGPAMFALTDTPDEIASEWKDHGEVMVTETR